MEEGAVARSPFHIPFISASSTEPVRRFPVGLRVASARVALIVLRALDQLSACSHRAQSRRSHSSRPDLGHVSRFRPRWAIFVRATDTIGRLQSAAFKLIESVPGGSSGSIMYLYAAEPRGPLRRRKKIGVLPLSLLLSCAPRFSERHSEPGGACGGG